MYEVQDDLSAHAFVEELQGIAGAVIETGESMFHRCNTAILYAVLVVHGGLRCLHDFNAHVFSRLVFCITHSRKFWI